MMLLPQQITGSVYLLRFSKSAEMAKALLRFQEYYESPKFRGEIFTLAEFKQWRMEKTGEFTYYTDWTGFNFPSWVLKPFRDEKFDPLTYEESLVIAATRDLPEPFYVIAVADNLSFEDGTHEPTDNDTSALRHEIAHGLWSTNVDYRTEILLAMEGRNLAPFYRWIYNNMYHPATWLDEAHAYLTCDFEYLLEQGAKVEPLRDLHEFLAKSFDYYTDSRFVGAV
jgi:hypothetical protein